MGVLTDLGPSDWGDLSATEKALSLVQHHDAVSGTAKQAVTNDYIKRLYNGLMECYQVINDAMNHIMTNGTQMFCTYLNVTVCEPSQNSESFLVTVFNGEAQNKSRYARIPFSHPNAAVIAVDPVSNQFYAVPYQIEKAEVNPQLAYVNDSAPYELVVRVDAPALGFKTVMVSAAPPTPKHAESNKIIKQRLDCLENDRTIGNKLVSVQFTKTGGIASVTNLVSNVTVTVRHSYCWYESHNGSGGHASGAYTFRPATNTTATCFGDPMSVEMIKGSLVQEVRQRFSEYVSQIVRVYVDKPYVELQWTVGPLPTDKNIGHEVITRFITNVESGSTFYTDSNGRQMVQRKLNYQPTYDYENSEPIAGNYYPVNSRIVLADKDRQVSILTDRSQGGSSLKSGSVELMVHRRLFHDDNKGVAEPLNEPGVDGKGLVARGLHWLLVDKPETAARSHRPLALEMYHQPIVGFVSLNSTNHLQHLGTDERVTEFTGLAGSLPENVHLLTLDQWQGRSILLRLEHFYQTQEDSELSKPATVNLEGLFSTFDIVSMEELNLSANQLLKDVHRFTWRPDTNQGLNETLLDRQSSSALDGLTVVLKPMQIRTFRCAIKMH